MLWRNSPFSKKYRMGNGFLAAAKKYEINKTTLMKWQRRYKVYGYEGLERRTHPVP